MASQPINLTDGPGATVLPPDDPELTDALAAAESETDPTLRRAGLENVAARFPRSSLAWALVGDHASSPIQRYAAYRVGYHRGLDALRANGWRGSGYVRWGSGGNDGFLRCLVGLRQMAAAIGEDDEAQRVEQFLVQLDPSANG